VQGVETIELFMQRRRRIKILFLIDRLLAGGTENQLLFLAENLPRDRFEPVVGVLAKTEHQTRLKIKTRTVNFNWLGPPVLKNVFLVWQLRRYLAKERFDIVQLYFVESQIYGAIAVQLCRHRPILIGTRRNLYHWIENEPWSFNLLRYTTRWTDHILVNSYKVLEECQKKEGIPPEKIMVIENAVEVEKFNNFCTHKAKSSIGLAGEYPIIGVVGNWRPVKGLITFLKAAGQIYHEMPSAYFVLVGFGEQERELKSLVRNVGIQNRVTFFKNFLDISKIMAAFDIAVQPSLSESSSNVLLEYMAASKPIVATRVGDAERIIENGKEGILIHPNNPDELSAAILYHCRNQNAAAIMSRLAREKVVANWSSDKILNKYYRFYEKIAKNIQEIK
jgi:glycosyltransferase involved in cell wall biosynthesis